MVTHQSDGHGGSQSSVPRLIRSLTFFDLVIYGLAYVTPTAPFQILGFVWQASNGLIVLAYILGGICMYFTARSYAEMSEAVPSAGSVYGFARNALGPFAGFLAGWMILLDYLMIPGYLYLLISVALGSLIPGIDRSVLIVLLCGLTLGINWFGVTVTSRVNLATVVLQSVYLVVLLVFCLLALHAGKGTGALTFKPVFSRELFHTHSIFAGTAICVMSYLGFDAISTLAEETRSDDKRIVGRAIVVVLVISASLFAFVAWILGNLLSGLTIKDPASASYELMEWAIGPWASISLAWAMATLIGLTNVVPMQVGVSRVLFAMGRDRQLPAALAKIHPKYGTPYIGMLVTTAISLAVAIAMRNRMDELASLVNFGALAGFLLLHVSVFVKFAVRGRSRRWFAHIVVPAAGAVVVLAVIAGMSSLALTLGIVWMIAGLLYGTVLHGRRRVALPV
jgi:amino acid transporter